MYIVQIRWADPNKSRKVGWHQVEDGKFTSQQEAEQYAIDLKAFAGNEADYRVKEGK